MKNQVQLIAYADRFGGSLPALNRLLRDHFRGLFGGIPTDWFNGAANQIEVYDVALTAAEVAEYPI